MLLSVVTNFYKVCTLEESGRSSATASRPLLFPEGCGHTRLDINGIIKCQYKNMKERVLDIRSSMALTSISAVPHIYINVYLDRKGPHHSAESQVVASLSVSESWPLPLIFKSRYFPATHPQNCWCALKGRKKLMA